MKKSAEEHAADDKAKRDEVETRNQADNLVFQSKKQLQEFGDKIPADKKKPLEDAIQKLEASAKTAPIAQLKSDIEALNKVWSEAATYMYQQQAQAAQQQPGAEQQGQQQQGQAEPKANTAENADYEIIDSSPSSRRWSSRRERSSFSWMNSTRSSEREQPRVRSTHRTC